MTDDDKSPEEINKDVNEIADLLKSCETMERKIEEIKVNKQENPDSILKQL